MTNNEIIRAEVQKHFTAAQIHDLAAAYCDPQEIAARVAAAADVADVVDENGNKIDPTPIVELDFVAAQFHTVKEWNRAGRCVKRDEKNAFKAMIWQHTDKPGAAARKAAEEEGRELPDDPHFYLAPAWFFHLGQTEPQAAAPAKMSAEELKAKNAQLLTAFKARLAAEKAAAQQQPAASAKPTAKPTTKPAAKQSAKKAATKRAAKSAAKTTTKSTTTKPAAKPTTKPAAAPSAAVIEPDFAALAASILF